MGTCREGMEEQKWGLILGHSSCTCFTFGVDSPGLEAFLDFRI